MSKVAINVPQAPEAIGPYSHANVVGDLVFVSGQMPIKDGQLEMDDIQQACRNCMDNIAKILDGAGSSMAKAAKFTIYLTDLADFAAVNEVYGSYFSGDYPARVCIQVSALPKGAAIEIDCIASL
ncbi:MAG: Rid family detoxifying hydrolase [Eubacteriales bacterium]|nr:Rid family detoxifying hydrolase [Eubacteriales bacterium]